MNLNFHAKADIGSSMVGQLTLHGPSAVPLSQNLSIWPKNTRNSALSSDSAWIKYKFRLRHKVSNKKQIINVVKSK